MRLCKTGAKLKFLKTGSSVNNNERNDRLAVTVGNYKVGIGKTTLLPGDCHALTSCYEISRPGRSGIRESAKKKRKPFRELYTRLRSAYRDMHMEKSYDI